MHPIRTLVLSLALFAPALAAAPALAQSKIGAIRTQAILQNAPQKKAAEAQFKAEFEKREQDLQNEGKKLSDDIKKYQREADTLSPQQRADTEKSINTRKIDFDLKQRTFSEQAQARNQELLRGLMDKVNAAIEAVAKEKGLDLVLQDPAYAAAGVDITDDVLKRLAADTTPVGGDKKKKK